MPKEKSTDLPPTIRISDAAKLLGVNPMTLRRWEKKGYLTPLRIGPRKDRRYFQDEVKRLLIKHKTT